MRQKDRFLKMNRKEEYSGKGFWKQRSQMEKNKNKLTPGILLSVRGSWGEGTSNSTAKPEFKLQSDFGCRQRGSASTLHGRKPGLASSDELLQIQPPLNTANSLLAVCHT